MSLTHYDCEGLQEKYGKNNLEIELPSNALLKCIFCQKYWYLFSTILLAQYSELWLEMSYLTYDHLTLSVECVIWSEMLNVTKDAYKTHCGTVLTGTDSALNLYFKSIFNWDSPLSLFSSPALGLICVWETTRVCLLSTEMHGQPDTNMNMYIQHLLH